jgi:mRNA interferase RelE/StbE
VTGPRVWQVEFEPDAARELRKLGGKDRDQIVAYLRTRIATTEDPTRFGKALLGDYKGYRRYRVGDFRIIARIEGDRFVVVILRVGHRRLVYE